MTSVQTGWVIFFLSAASSFAQQQEQKLVDRLLKPDLTLANSAQTKQFAPTRQTPSKTVKARQFYVRAAASTREFAGGRNFFAQIFRPRSFHRGSEVARIDARRSEEKMFVTVAAPQLRQTSDETRTVATGGYPGEHAFTPSGKSQKSLSAQDTPMTVEQVRELLNRNK